MDWDNATPFQQLAFRPCRPCEGEVTEHRVIIDRHTGEPKQWFCIRCRTKSGVIFPFSPIEVPDGRAQIHAALKTLAIYAPVVMNVDQKRLYAVTRRYFAAGWSVKDLLRAIDYRPDDSPHETAAISIRDPGDTVLGRLQTRLREWVWRDRFEDDEGGDIMPGPYTTMRNAMRVRAEEQNIRAFSRAIEWSERQQGAQAAAQSDVAKLARMQIADAINLANKTKRTGGQREAAAVAELVTWAQNRSGEEAATHK